MRAAGVFFGAALFVAAVPSAAETLHINELYPAENDAAAALRAIGIDQFGGEAGPDLAFRIEDALRSATFGGQPWLRVIPAGSNAPVDAVMRGTTGIDQQTTDYTEEHERCVKGPDGKCTAAKEKFQARCKRRQISLSVTLRLVASDGRLIWSRNRPETNEDTWCEDSSGSQRSRSNVLRQLADRAAAGIVADFVPHEAAEEIRVDESRKNLSKNDANAFKAAVKKVKDRDFAGACADWRSLASTNPTHAPSLYNIGLCAEFAGEDGPASDYYRKALAIDRNHVKAQAGLDRIAARSRARHQIEAHGAP